MLGFIRARSQHDYHQKAGSTEVAISLHHSYPLRMLMGTEKGLNPPGDNGSPRPIGLVLSDEPGVELRNSTRQVVSTGHTSIVQRGMRRISVSEPSSNLPYARSTASPANHPWDSYVTHSHAIQDHGMRVITALPSDFCVRSWSPCGWSRISTRRASHAASDCEPV